MIRDSRLCEAAHHLLGTDLRQKHQIGVWVKFFLTFSKIKVLKNIFFPLYTISTASPINITLLYQGHLNIYLPGLLKGGRSELKCKFVL